MQNFRPLVRGSMAAGVILCVAITWVFLAPVHQLAQTVELLVIAEDTGPLFGRYSFDWSPDGKYVVLVDYSDKGSLCRRELSTRDKRCILTRYASSIQPGWYSNPHWSPDGKHIAFDDIAQTGSHCPRINLNVIDAEMNENSIVRIGPVTEYHWSPDGKQLAFLEINGCPESEHRGRIGILDMQAAETSYITDWGGPFVLARILGLSPWSPNGTELAFMRNKNFLSPFALYTIAVDGTNETRVVDAIGALVGWTWDGTGLIYSDGMATNVVDKTGKNPRFLGNGNTIALSPDRRKLALSGKKLLIVDIDSGQQVAIDRPDRHIDPSKIPGCSYGQSWSPDGKRLAFTCVEPSKAIPPFSIFVVNVDGTGLTKVAGGYSPMWSPDGRYLAYIARKVN